MPLNKSEFFKLTSRDIVYSQQRISKFEQNNIVNNFSSLFSRNLYECPADTPKHLAVAVNKWKYRLLYERYFGGVTALSKKQFRAVDGFANSFYGWGGEDDDLHHRYSTYLREDRLRVHFNN